MSVFGWRREQKILDEGARRTAPGSFIRLTHGFTHFEQSGPQGLRSVILVHGFLVPYVIWDRTVPALRDAGLHCIRYDLYGRGFSDRPQTDYDISLFVEQLDGLVAALGCEQVDLVALSMGGPIAAAFAVSCPERVRRLVLIDPSGLGSAKANGLRAVASLPGMSQALLAVLGSDRMLERITAAFYDPAEIDMLREQCRIQMDYGGFGRAVVSAIRHGMLGSFCSTYAQLGELRKDILLVWGRDDRTIPVRDSALLRKLLPEAQFLPIAHAGHIPHIERPEAVMPRLVQFLS